MEPPSSGSADDAVNVRVVCRFRPQNKKELERNVGTVQSVGSDNKTVTIKGETTGTHTFSFDRIFNEDSNQKDVYDYGARQTVADIFNGYNGTIFVYGQTGAGKTHTMSGPSIDDEELKGVIPRMNEQIFHQIRSASEELEFLVKASYIQIYMEKIGDLLDTKKSNLQVREDPQKGLWLEGVTEVYVSSEEEVLEVIRVGTNNKAVASTNMNATSSRSHTVFILTINQKNLKDMSNRTGKLYLVDLAGSEKVEKTGAKGATLEEAKMINKSLSALGNVINALTDGKSKHIPYRDSKLTRLLQDSLGGNCRTTLIINCSPSSYNEAETLSTLRFGNRAKAIKNAAKVNRELTVGELKILLQKAEKEINTLKQQVVQLKKEKGIPLEESEKEPTVDPELEQKFKQLTEEKQDIQERMEIAEIEVKEKERRIEELSQYVEKLKIEQKTALKENEVLLLRLADMTIKNDKLKFSQEENRLLIEQLQTENKQLQLDLSTSKRRTMDKPSFDKFNIRRSFDKKNSQSDSLDHQSSKDDVIRKSIDRSMDQFKQMEQSCLSHSVTEHSTEASHPNEHTSSDQQAPLAQQQASVVHSETPNESQLQKTGSQTQQKTSETTAPTTTTQNIAEPTTKSPISQESSLIDLSEPSVSNFVPTQKPAESFDQTTTSSEQQAQQQTSVVHSETPNEPHLQKTGSQTQQKTSETTATTTKKTTQNIAEPATKSPISQESSLIDLSEPVHTELSEHQQLGQAFEQLRKETTEKLRVYDDLRENLLQELENRTRKMLEMESLLEEAREMYTTQILQVKNSSSKNLQQKCLVLQRNLEHVQQVNTDLVEKYNRLQLENQVQVKQLVIRNERINNLELQLQDAAEKMQNLANQTNIISPTKKVLSPSVKPQGKSVASKKSAAAAPPTFTGGKIAKPIRGGQNLSDPAPNPNSNSTPSSAEKKGFFQSFW